jgi:hypothetical protein
VVVISEGLGIIGRAESRAWVTGNFAPIPAVRRTTYRTAGRSRSDLRRSKIASQSLLRPKFSSVTKNLRMPD